MSKQIESRIIDGKTFLITKLNVEDALKVLIWLTKSIGGSVTKSLGHFESLSKLKEDGDFDIGKFSNVIDGLFDKIDEKETIEKIGILLTAVSHETQGLNFNHPVLVGEPLLALQLSKASIEVNFKSFLQGISAALGKVTKLAAEKTTLKEAT